MLMIATIITTISIYFIQSILYRIVLIFFFFLPIFISSILLVRIVLILHIKIKNLKKNYNINNQSSHRKKLNQDIRIIVYLLAVLINLFLGTFIEIYNCTNFIIFVNTIPFQNQVYCDSLYKCLDLLLFAIFPINDSIILLIFNNRIRKNIFLIFSKLKIRN